MSMNSGFTFGEPSHLVGNIANSISAGAKVAGKTGRKAFEASQSEHRATQAAHLSHSHNMALADKFHSNEIASIRAHGEESRAVAEHAHGLGAKRVNTESTSNSGSRNTSIEFAAPKKAKSAKAPTPEASGPRKSRSTFQPATEPHDSWSTR